MIRVQLIGRAEVCRDEAFSRDRESSCCLVKLLRFTNHENAHSMSMRRVFMKSMQINQARKRAVNLTLNEDLLVQAKGMTNNRSGMFEQLLADYVQKQNNARQEKLHNANEATQAWNAFNEQSGSFADEHSTL